MKNVAQWIWLDPLDTLFFKGSESMVAGQDHEAGTVFPPMPSTIIGAIRGAVLGQRGILDEFVQSGGRSDTIAKRYPCLGTAREAGFDIFGPFFEYRATNGSRDLFFPAPAHWFADLERVGAAERIVVQRAEAIDQMIQEVGLTGSVQGPLWVLDPEGENLKNLHGFIVNPAAFHAMTDGRAVLRYAETLESAAPDQPVVLPGEAVFKNEERVGIALDADNGSRRVKTGHLYATRHARLNSGVSLVIGLSEALIPDYLDESGILQLGGEQRIVRYGPWDGTPRWPDSAGPWAMALKPFTADRFRELGWQDHPRGSGPLIRMGGWDMKKKFHKDMTAFFPAGTVVRTGFETPLPFGFTYI